MEHKKFRALGNKTRFAIVTSLLQGEKNVTDLAKQYKKSQPLISQHLSLLKECGIVKARYDARYRYYYVAKPASVVKALEAVNRI